MIVLIRSFWTFADLSAIAALTPAYYELPEPLLAGGPPPRRGAELVPEPDPELVREPDPEPDPEAFMQALNLLMGRYMPHENDRVLCNLFAVNRTMSQDPVLMRMLLERMAKAAYVFKRRWMLSRANMELVREELSAKERLIRQLHRQLNDAWAWMIRLLTPQQVADFSEQLIDETSAWQPVRSIAAPAPGEAQNVEMIDQEQEVP